MELLQAMYIREGELTIDDEFSLTLNLVVDDVLIMLSIVLPDGYPEVCFSFRIQCERLSRDASDRLRQDLESMLEGLVGSPCVIQAVEWLQEHAPGYFMEVKTISEEVQATAAEAPRKGLRHGSRCAMWEEHCDLFCVGQEWSLCHCVSKDLNMGAGIAVDFKKRFGGLEELRSQNVEVGGVAVLQKGDRFVYYLVTKNKYGGKPSMATLEASLKAMRTHMLENSVSKLAMPHIGCGLDRLSWGAVQELILQTFDSDSVEILACKN